MDAWEPVPSFTRAVPAAGTQEQRWIHGVLAPEVTYTSDLPGCLIFILSDSSPWK